MPADEGSSPQRTFRALDERFDSAVDSLVLGVPVVGLLFSGGVDSALVALALRERVPFDALAIGVRGSRDLAQASSAARILDLPLTRVEVSVEEVRRAALEMAPLLRESREPVRSVQLSLALAVRTSERSVVVTGQGADELFGGYAHFRKLEPSAAEQRRIADLAQLLEGDWPRSLAIARAFGKDLRSPYLDPSFRAYASSIPLPPLPAGGTTKPLLREWAVHRGVPREIAGRAKLAIQYGTGIARLLRREPATSSPSSNPSSRGVSHRAP
ncbi:MAG: asparagine synthase C-terminal domain-containing protein [Thermoplasmata archaeon]|nr:asparagine synthase C-terminal domain-containing protein [Thermoplasmata archaeon]